MGTETNKHGLSRRIPNEIKRQVRRECGYGCVACGSAIYEYDHFNPPFEEAKQHDPAGIALLCGGCHARKTRGYLSAVTIAKLRAAPICLRDGFSHFPIDVGSEGPFSVAFGEISVEIERLVEINGLEILRVRPPEAPGAPPRLSARFFDGTGREIAAVVDNEWRGSVEAWDIEAIGGRMLVRSRPYQRDLEISFESPYRVVIERLHLRHGAVLLKGSRETGFTVRAGRSQVELPPGFPAVKRAPAFLSVDGNSIWLGLDIVGEMQDERRRSHPMPGFVRVDGCNIEFVDPGSAGVPLPGRLPGGKVMRVKGDKGDFIQPEFRIPHDLERVWIELPARNEPCYCGSGKKYKKCHGRPV